MRSHRCIVIVLSNTNWILFCLGMEHLIFSPSSNVCRMRSSFSAVIPYSPDRCRAFQDKPPHESNRVLGSSEVLVYVAAWKVTSLSWAASEGRSSEMAGLGAFSKRNCGRDSRGGGARGLQPGSRWVMCLLLHLLQENVPCVLIK